MHPHRMIKNPFRTMIKFINDRAETTPFIGIKNYIEGKKYINK